MAVQGHTESGVVPKSTHVTDPSLRPFLQPTFDPADYLNASLPPLALAGQGVSSRGAASATAVSLSDLSSRAQILLSQLNAQTSRLSTVLTQLTDDILRSGGRLAYEVEVLRGETIGLSEVLTEGLHQDITRFLPFGLAGTVTAVSSATPTDESVTAATVPSAYEGRQDGADISTDSGVVTNQPTFVTQLRTLTQVRARLESVIKIFGEAMQWTLPPSEVSLTSSLISVSAPEQGADSQSREEKGREFADKLRSEIADLVAGSGRDEDGHDIAMSRIAALRDLAQVWKGTAEEKARVKFVEGLVRLAEERQRTNTKASASRRVGHARSVSPKKAIGPEKGKGFLDNLQMMRDSIYLE